MIYFIAFSEGGHFIKVRGTSTRHTKKIRYLRKTYKGTLIVLFKCGYLYDSILESQAYKQSINKRSYGKDRYKKLLQIIDLIHLETS